MKKFNLKILTPNFTLIDTKVDVINLEAQNGRIGLLRNHVPFMSSIKLSDFSYEIDGKKYDGIFMNGLVYMDGKECIIITTNATLKEDIDIRFAKENIEILKKKLIEEKNISKYKINDINKKILYYEKQL